VTAPLRGQIFHVDLGHGRKPWLVVSNNARNRNLDSVLAARITTPASTPRSRRSFRSAQPIR
jgi:mRNA interferase MazF